MPSGPIGILMLDTRFPRPVGDIGHPDSFSVPVLYRTVRRASARQAVQGDADALLAGFIAAGTDLVADGVVLIGTSCGFLSLLQDELQAALGVPVLASALGLAAGNEDRTGILTIDAKALSLRHLRAAGITRPVPVAGLQPNGELATVIFGDREELDMARAEAEMVAAARALIAAHPSVATILCECTNMGPYAPAIREAVDRPVLTIIDALEAALP